MHIEKSNDKITDYERAVCYYTLPKVVSPLTLGLIIAYGVCVLEAIGASVYGLTTGNSSWTTAGGIALVGIVLLGMMLFTIRALLNDWNKRLVLASARNAPAAQEDDNVPDPFAGHVLLQHPINVQSELFACVTIEGQIEYYVEVKRRNWHWRVCTPQDQPFFEILALQGARWLGLSAPLPARLGLYSNNVEIASLVRRSTLHANIVDIFPTNPNEQSYAVKNGCIYCQGRLLGRIYTLRQAVYLDIEKQHLTPGVLAHFVTLK